MYFEVDPHGDTLITLQDADDEPSSPAKTENGAPSGKQYLVSRKHLMLASRRAGKVLGGSFSEATPKEDGRFHWKFEPIFDPRAFEIVMRIIHGQSRDVPVSMDVTLLAQITAIVDDLECHDAVWYFAKGWLVQIKDRIPSSLCEDLMRWILISYVFEEPGLFKTATATAIRHCTYHIPSYNLPIRPKILGDINVQRQSIIAYLLARLSNLESQLLGQSLGCSQGCRAMMLGTLSQGLRSSSLSLLPSPPYVSLDISSTLYKLRAIEGLDYYCAEQEGIDETKSGHWRLEVRPLPRQKPSSQDFWGSAKKENVPLKLVRHKCRLEDHLRGLMDTTDAEVKGLELAKYLSK